MLITIDIGNSNIVCVVYSASKERLYDKRFETIKENIEEAYPKFVKEELLFLKVRFNCEAVMLSNVVPAIDQVVFNALKEGLAIDVYRCDLSTVPNFKVMLDDPRELGADFIATSYGAMAKYPLPIIVADLGSATKVSALNLEGNFAGGIIMPGLRIAQDALNRFIPHLPQIPLVVPKSVLGSDTITAMQAGLMYSTIDSIEGIARRIESSFDTRCSKVLTGGLSILIHDDTKDFVYEPYLLNEGLFEIYQLLK
jgi:type III pantothenate kinase